MRRRTLGRSGISVSPLCLGTMMLGAWGNPDHDEAVRIIRTALDAGINIVDTADVYSAGECEVIVGKALQGRRDDVVLATKANFPMGEDPNRSGNSRRWLTRALDDSLRRLGTDHVDLYQVHRPDPETDIDETLAALTDFVRAGKVRAIGTSTFPAQEIVEAQWVAERRGHARFRSEQPPYSVLTRSVEAAVLPTCAAYGIGVLTWAPLSGGWLSGKYRRPEDVDLGAGRASRVPRRFDLSVPANVAKLEVVEQLAELADEAGCTLPQLAVAFTLAHPAVTAAIIGPRTMEQLTGLLAGASVVLGDDVLDAIDRIVPPGTDVNPADAGWVPPALREVGRRRRPAADRAASA
jgi:aryl-alcohol dehydrogenase-like predicted oxidoreductase